MLWQVVHGTQEIGTAVVNDEFPSSCDERLEASLEDMNDDCRLTPHHLTLLQNELNALLAEKCLFPDPGLWKCFQVYEVCLLRAACGTFNVFGIFSTSIFRAFACINWYLIGVLRRRCPKLFIIFSYQIHYKFQNSKYKPSVSLFIPYITCISEL
jgi:hypothetical protein